MSVVISGAVEGVTDEAALRRIAECVGINMGNVSITGGKRRLDKQLSGYDNAAKFSPWCVVRDLDMDASCAAELVSRLLPSPAEHMRLRIAVRSIEAWMMADRERFARFLSVARSVVPGSPDDLDDPKETLVNLARKSKKRDVREGLVPGERSGRRVGTGYTSFVIEYVQTQWRPDVAATSSDSLRRCMDRLKTLAANEEL